MHPYLHVGPLSLSTYALWIAVGWLVGVQVAVWMARRAGLPGKRIVDLAFWILVAAIVGSRLGYWIEAAPVYVGQCLDETLSAAARPPLCDDFWKPWRGGFVFYGGLALAVPTVWFLVRRYGLALRPTFDAFAPALAVAHAFGRVGCFFGGCCYGAVCHVPWAARFPAESLPGAAPRHPTQLYEAGAELAIFVGLVLLARRRPPAGRLFAAWLAAYGAARFAIELFRGDPQRGYAVTIEWDALRQLLGLPPGHAPLLSWAQAISVALVLVGVWLWRRSGARPRGAA